jgi:DNA-binding CsgD family transcriptional regulator
MPGHHPKHALLGRRRECETLDRVIDDAKAGQSRVLVLRGEAGMGKSALLDHLAASADGCRVARVAGVESEMELAFAALHHLCAPMLHRRDQLPDPQRDALGTAFGLSAGHPPDRFLVGLAALSLLSDMAEERPLVCLVDDAQWLDQASAQVLGFVARRLLAEPVALVFAAREPNDGNELAGIPDLMIGGLADGDARALLDSSIPWSLDERVKARMVAETGGNPLALLELPRGLTAAEVEFGFGLPATTPMVNRIEEGFLRQLQPLPSDTRRLLLIAAVEPLGDVPLLWRAAESLGIDRHAATPAETAGLINFGIRAQFRHPLVRSAARRAAELHDLRDAHRALAEVTDAELDPDRCAWHRAHAAAGPDEAVASDLVRAATRARRRGGYAAAAALLERAIELTPDAAQRGSRALAAALAKLFAADSEGGLKHIANAEMCPLDEVERAKLERLRASLIMSLGDSDEGSLMSLEAAQRLEPLDAHTARAAHFSALSTRAFIGRLGDARRLREFAEAARAAPAAPDPPRVTDLLLDGLATRYLDGYRTALPLLRRAIDACEQEREPGLQLAEWVVFIPTLPPEVWDDQAWHRLTAHLIAVTREAGGFLNIPMALDYRASFDIHAGRLAAASALVEESAAIREATGSTPALSGMELAAWRGHEAPALELIDTSIDFWTARGDGRWISLAEYARAVLFNGLGRYDAAFEAARSACEHDDLGIHGWALAELVEAGARSSNIDIAQDGARRLEEQTGAAGTDWALGVEARSRALLSDGDTADTLYRDAIDHLASTRMRVDLARAHLLYGEWLRREQRRLDAREQLRRAHEMLTDMGAAAFAERARRELLATGETVRKRSVDPSDALTPQEVQIARLAADGESNPEIGSRLFISPRTVEYHLSKVFVKLGVKSRRELRRALAPVQR